MIKTITKIGNSHGIILDSTFLQLSHRESGDEVSVEVNSRGMIPIAPLSPAQIPVTTATATAKRLIAKNDELFKRMALATCLVYLSENGFVQEEALDVDDREKLILAVAAGLLSRKEITATLREPLC